LARELVRRPDGDCLLLDRIIDTQRHWEAMSEAPRPVKPSHIAHFNRLTECVLDHQRRYPKVYSGYHAWTDYVTGTCEEQKLLDGYILGSGLMDHGQASNVAIASLSCIDHKDLGIQDQDDENQKDDGVDLFYINSVFPTGADERVHK
jgi:hypothetical protein